MNTRQGSRGETWRGADRKGSQGVAWPAEARRGAARKGSRGKARRGRARHNVARKGSRGGAWQSGHGSVGRGQARQSRRGMAGRGQERQSRRGEAGQSGQGWARQGMAWQGSQGGAWPGRARTGRAVEAGTGEAGTGEAVKAWTVKAWTGKAGQSGQGEVWTGKARRGKATLNNKQEQTMKLNKETKQQIIDEYLADTGRNVFIPREFIEYLQDKPDHNAHASFYNVSEAELAMQAREDIARKWARGLRLTLTIEVKHPDPKVSVVNIVQVEAPRLFSPMQGRSNGGGYVVLDAHDTTQQQQFKNEAANALRSFLRRYGLPLAQSGVDQSRITTIIAALENAETTEALEA